MPEPSPPLNDNGYKLLGYLQNYVRTDEHQRLMGELKEYIREIEKQMNKDTAEIREDLKRLGEELRQVKDAIIEKQKESYRRIIGIQAMLLSPVVIAVIIYIVQAFLPK